MLRAKGAPQGWRPEASEAFLLRGNKGTEAVPDRKCSTPLLQHTAAEKKRKGASVAPNAPYKGGNPQ